MSYQKINFSPTSELSVSRLGGLPLLPGSVPWPSDPEGNPMLLLASLAPGFLDAHCPECAVPAGHLLSIFMSFDPGSRPILRKLAIQDGGATVPPASGYSRVLLHPTGESPSTPPPGAPPILGPFAMSLEQVADGDSESPPPYSGDTLSKVGGVPAWIQDAIELTGYRYVLQFEEFGIGKLSKLHDGLFSEGNAFLFLEPGLPPPEPGVLFIQFS